MAISTPVHHAFDLQGRLRWRSDTTQCTEGQFPIFRRHSVSAYEKPVFRTLSGGTSGKDGAYHSARASETPSYPKVAGSG